MQTVPFVFFLCRPNWLENSVAIVILFFPITDSVRLLTINNYKCKLLIFIYFPLFPFFFSSSSHQHRKISQRKCSIHISEYWKRYDFNYEFSFRNIYPLSARWPTDVGCRDKIANIQFLLLFSFMIYSWINITIAISLNYFHLEIFW